MKDSKSISRRNFVKISGAAAIGASLMKFGDDMLSVREAYADDSMPATPDEALKKLMAGNKRFVDSVKKNPRRTVEVRKELVEGQWPFATILACADARVPPEVIFDQGLGDLFVVRVAGNFVNPSNYAVLGSLEYGVLVLGSSVLMVLGHSNCGAVTGAINVVQKGTEYPGSINEIVNSIGPAVVEAKGETGDLLENSIVSNIQLQVDKLIGSVPILGDKVREGKLKIVGGNYDLYTGEVKIVT